MRCLGKILGIWRALSMGINHAGRCRKGYCSYCSLVTPKKVEKVWTNELPCILNLYTVYHIIYIYIITYKFRDVFTSKWVAWSQWSAMRIRPFFSYIYKFWTSPGTPLWLFGASKWIHVAFFSQAQFSTWTMESGSSNSILEQLRLHILGMIIHELAQKMSGNSFQYLKMTALPLSKSVIEFLLGPAVVIPTVWASDLPGSFLEW